LDGGGVAPKPSQRTVNGIGKAQNKGITAKQKNHCLQTAALSWRTKDQKSGDQNKWEKESLKISIPKKKKQSEWVGGRKSWKMGSLGPGHKP